MSKFPGEVNLAEGYQQQVEQNTSEGQETRTHHVVNGRDIAHWGGVARSLLDLLTVREGFTETDVDKVVSG